MILKGPESFWSRTNVQGMAQEPHHVPDGSWFIHVNYKPFHCEPSSKHCSFKKKRFLQFAEHIDPQESLTLCDCPSHVWLRPLTPASSGLLQGASAAVALLKRLKSTICRSQCAEKRRKSNGFFDHHMMIWWSYRIRIYLCIKLSCHHHIISNRFILIAFFWNKSSTKDEFQPYHYTSHSAHRNLRQDTLVQPELLLRHASTLWRIFSKFNWTKHVAITSVFLRPGEGTQ